MSATILETERLYLRRLDLGDASFIFDLLNQPSFLEFIGDRGVRSLDGARDYIAHGPMDSYERFGFGLYLVALKSGGTPVGLCGLLKRETLDDVDIGFAFLPKYWSKGYALEAAAAVMQYGRTSLGLRRIVAITNPNNRASIGLLEKLGLKLEGSIRLNAATPEILLFG